MSTLFRSIGLFRSMVTRKVVANGYSTARPAKVEYDSTQVFLKKAEEHLLTGDVAQSCEKLFGCTKYALRSYVDDLLHLHRMPPVALEHWDYMKYRKVVNIVANTLDEDAKKDLVMRLDFSFVLHVKGWNQNQMEYEDAEMGIETIRRFVQQIAHLPKNKELATKIYLKIFANQRRSKG